MCSCCSLRHETGRPWHCPRNPGGSQLRNPGLPIFSLLLSPDAGAALDVCVASSNAAAVRGDAAQAASDRKLSHYRNEIGELRQQNVHNRLLVWTADGRPRPAVTRTLQYAADIASSRNEQHLSAKSVHRRWTHEIQIGLLCEGSHGSRSCPESFSEGRAALRRHHRQTSAPGDVSPLLTVGPATTTSTTLRLTQPYPTPLSPWRAARMNLCSHQVSNCPVYLRVRKGEVVVGRRWRSHATSRTHSGPGQYCSAAISTSRTASRTRGVGVQHVLDLMELEDDVFQRCLSAQPDLTALQRTNRGKVLTSYATSTLRLPCRPTARFSHCGCWT